MVDLKKLSQLDKAGTKEPWEYSVENNGSIFGDMNTDHDGDNPYIGTIPDATNGNLTVAMRNCFPEMIQELKELRECLAVACETEDNLYVLNKKYKEALEKISNQKLHHSPCCEIAEQALKDEWENNDE